MQPERRVLDRQEEAARRDYLALFPTATISGLKRLPFKSANDAERIWTGLRQAGLPE